ncbi:filament-like plant protein 4 [Oryza glaberrima]|uniref:Filament-like plant protein 4 n=1 Tax=Oryza glaberrima TaxID=4538 RepID=I1P9F5_ORYGL|nr:filament-like plant protein 4 [Oryza glaberrima]XP_052146661.1 filament-like plant protein 4 [Oryza glaberrima]
MDRRSWPWKKKSSDKSSSADASQNSNQAEQDDKAPKYVQISPETYAHLTESEEQVKTLNEKVKALNEDLSAAQSEITTKDALVKQHAKVAEEAVSGWEKAEAEASALKLQLETVTLAKLAAEERTAHLDGALKECMKQVRTVKEEGEQKLHDVVFAKTKQWEKIKAEFEAKLLEFEQELIRAGAENDALSRSLEERGDLLMKIDEEKARAEAEIEVLKNTIQSGEREINSLKYEIHVVSKELEIRNEEKNMSVRSADVATKQHMEDVKKISKLEAECQRLRGLVRKKLPGPAALAQMKMEVESLGRDYGESRLRRSPAKNSSFHRPMSPMSPVPDYAFENLQHMQKENEFLTARLLSMEDETKMLKEALAKRNSELQTSRNMYAKTAGKLRGLEVQMLTGSQRKSTSNPNMDIHFDGALSQNGSNPPSMTSMSEDGVDDEGSCTESWANALVSELSHIKKEKGAKSSVTEGSNRLELMDDFLEMEKLACLSSEANGHVSTVEKMKIDDTEASLSGITERDGVKDSQSVLALPGTPSNKLQLSDSSPLLKLQSRISSLLDSESPQNNAGNILDSIRNILKDIEDEADSSNDSKTHYGDMVEVADNGSLMKHSSSGSKHAMDQELVNAILKIQDFVKSLDQEVSKFQGQSSDCDGLCDKIQQFSALVEKALSNENVLNDIVMTLSLILSGTSEIKFMMLKENTKEADNNNLDYVDKVTLLENKVQLEPLKDSISGPCLPRSSSDPEIEGPTDSGCDVKTAVQICSSEEFEQLKSEKLNLEAELSKCNEVIEETKFRFKELEKSLEELTSKLVASEKSNSLAETQLKCMAESYKSLESRKAELENEIKVLQSKIEALTAELDDERQNHQEDITRYRDLEEKIERYENERNSMCVDEDADTKAKQEKEIAAAAEKLAECQETILILGRQLQSMRPPAESMGSSPNQRMEDFLQDAAGTTEGVEYSQKPTGQLDTDQEMHASGNESPVNGYKTHNAPSEADGSPFLSPNGSKRPKHRSRSSSSISNQLPEKQNRGFSRFFAKEKI